MELNSHLVMNAALVTPLQCVSTNGDVCLTQTNINQQQYFNLIFLFQNRYVFLVGGGQHLIFVTRCAMNICVMPMLCSMQLLQSSPDQNAIRVHIHCIKPHHFAFLIPLLFLSECIFVFQKKSQEKYTNSVVSIQFSILIFFLNVNFICTYKV